MHEGYIAHSKIHSREDVFCYHGEAEERSHGYLLFTENTGEFGCISLQNKIFS